MIQKFKDFMNEGMSNLTMRVISVQNEMEDLIEEPFITAVHGTEFDYNVDNDTDGAGDVNIFVEINNASPEAFEQIENDYDSFIAPFRKWAEGKDLFNPEILTRKEDNSITYSVTEFGKSKR